jgi:hypothetical protein
LAVYRLSPRQRVPQRQIPHAAKAGDLRCNISDPNPGGTAMAKKRKHMAKRIGKRKSVSKKVAPKRRKVARVVVFPG